MLSGKLLLCAVLIAVWPDAESASVRFVPLHVAGDSIPRAAPAAPRVTAELSLAWPKVREGVPPPLCAGRCASPPAGPVCAFDAAGTARTFATLCELEAVSCRESTYYAIASLGEC